MARYNQAAGYYQSKDFEKALDGYRAARDLAETHGDVAGVGFSLAGLGATQQELKQYNEAIESFEEAIPYLKASQNLGTQALTYAAIGQVQIQLKQDHRAIEAFQRALIIAEDLPIESSEQDTLMILAHRGRVLFLTAQAYERLGTFSDAVSTYRAAAAESSKTGNSELKSAALWGGGHASSKMGDLEQAIALLTEAASLLDSNSKLTAAAWVKWELGQVQFAASKFEDSINTFSSAIKISEDEGLTDLAAGLHFGMGQSLEKLSAFDKALASYRAALVQMRAGKGRTQTALIEASTLHNMGVIHRWLSQYEEAIENLRIAALKYQELNHSGGQGEVLTQLAEIFSWIAEPVTSVGYYKNALEIYRNLGDLPRQVEVLAALGEAGYLTDEVSYEEGDKYFNEGQQLTDLLTGIDPYVRAKIVGQEKTASNDEWSKILREWQEMLPTLKPEYRRAAGVLYQKWGRAALSSKDLYSARRRLMLASIYHAILPCLRLVEINREIAIECAKDAYFLGEVSRQGRTMEGALEYFKIAEEIAIALRTPEVHFVYAGLARTYADQGDIAKALEYYKKGIEILDSVQGEQGTEEIKIGVFAGALYEYRGFVRLLLEAYRQSGEHRYLHDSFEYNQKMKARVFLEMLTRSHTNRGSKAATTASPEEEIRRKIAQVHHRLQGPRLAQPEESKLLEHLEDLRGTWRDVQLKLAQVDPRRSRLASSQVTTVADVQAILDTDAVLLEYSAAYDGFLLWAITREQISAFNLPAMDALHPMLEGYLRSLRQPLIGKDEIASHVELGRKLYTVLLGPVAEMLPGKKHLIIAPDGPLHHLPFETLISSVGSNRLDRITVPKDIEYIIKQFEITYVPSASVFVAQRGEQRTKPQAELPLLAFGDALYSGAKQSESYETKTLTLRGRGFSRLEFSAEEVLGIARIWGVASTSQHINLRERASVKHLRNIDLSQYRILHFATHAVITDQVNVLTQPALVLSQNSEGEDGAGLLQFSDIRDLKLNADLVVLSACDTGLGRLRDGEGIVGLTRAFLHAGAASAVVSLWEVEDQSTSLLMEQFHRRLKDGADKAQALRQAKLDLMDSTANLKATGNKQSFAAPFYWAPFVIVGDWRAILPN